MNRYWVITFFLLSASWAKAEAQTNSLLSAWLAKQPDIKTWSADFVQTRSFKSLTQPLTATGHVWFAEPNRFRWELGNPPRTIAVRASDEMLVIYPILKRIERFPLTGDQAGPWHDALALLEAGFPRNQAELESRFNILSQNVTNEVCDVVLEPKSPTAKQMMPQLKIAFDTKDLSLKATGLQFADGSTMRNDFENPVFNPKLDPDIFSPKVGPDYKIVEPLKSAH